MQLLKTEDGSHTIYLPELDEHYHSTHGAIQEANHVFIQTGIVDYLENNSAERDQPIRIFEMGFGTGLNAFLTFLYAEENKIPLQMWSIEAHPVDLKTVAGLNYVDRLEKETYQSHFEKIHASEWGKEIEITPQFTFTKIQGDICNATLPNQIDIVFFDAFSPQVQPEVWELPVFEQLFKAVKPGGVLVTYCAQGQMRRNLRAAGFETERKPGPPGKREMTKATKPKT